VPAALASRLSELVSLVHEARDRTELVASLIAGLSHLSISGFWLATRLTSGTSSDWEAILSSYPADLHDSLIDLDFYAAKPAVQAALSSRHVQFWGAPKAGSPPHHRRVSEFLAAIPVASGVVVPLPTRSHRVNIACFCARNTQFEHTDLIANYLTVVGKLVLMRVESMGIGDRRDVSGLTETQREIVSWLAQGKSSTDIATILGMSKRAVDYHAAECLRKLGVSSRKQAIAMLGSSH
jgi:LuxR family quorum-sensing system transcriptional regulator CciR